MKLIGQTLLFLLLLFQLPQLAARPYIVGIVPQYEASKLHRVWRPILDNLQQETGLEFEIRGSYSISEFERQLSNVVFDFAYMNPSLFVVANKNAGYIPVVRYVGNTLYGVLVVRKDSGILSPSELNGKTIAFPAPNALAASLMIQQELTETFAIKFQKLFAKSHDSVYLNVMLGLADAGGGVQKTLSQQKPEIQQNLKILYETQPVAPHPFAALPSVPEQDRIAVSRALLKLGSMYGGQELLQKVPIKRIGPASMEDYLPLAELGLEKYYVSPAQ